MPWSEVEDLNEEVKQDVGIFPSSVAVPRAGGRTAHGVQNHYSVCAKTLQQGYSTAEALAIWNGVPAGMKNAPATDTIARAVAKLAINARVPIPQGCLDRLGGVTHAPKSYFYVATLGTPIIMGELRAKKFIVFIHRNMDDNYRERWYDLTGREQCEWYKAFEACQFNHVRNVERTRGLRGTNISLLTTTQQLAEAAQISPSIVLRRPQTHPVPAANWPVRRGLF